MTPLRSVQSAVQQFLRLQSAGGIMLVTAAVLATVLMNMPFATGYYAALLRLPLTIQIGEVGLSKPLLLWVNDGLMAIFFFLVGLELKREFLEGELASRAQAVLPIVAAAGGMLVPALVYWTINAGDPVTLKGWAIPAATDIAFAVGVLTLLGTRVPPSLKIFLLALAIMDDLGAIVIIAVFYSTDLSKIAFGAAVLALVVLFGLNRRGVMRPTAYYLVGVALWLAVLKSGVHATVAGVLCALFVPLRPRHDGEPSPLRTLEHDLHPWVAYGILPLFAFMNAGIDFEGLGVGSLREPVSLGVGAGLFLGKQVGVFLTVLLMVKLGAVPRPEGATWLQVYGVSLLCGIGFTMSLFIGGLAFEADGDRFETQVRLGVVAGSILSALLGYAVLRFAGGRGAARQAPA